MHRARSGEAAGNLGALQRALVWARNGLWGLFGLGLERQGPEEGGPLANGAAESWAGRSSAGAAGVIGNDAGHTAVDAGAAAATAQGAGPAAGTNDGGVSTAPAAAAEDRQGEPQAGVDGDDSPGKRVAH